MMKQADKSRESENRSHSVSSVHRDFTRQQSLNDKSVVLPSELEDIPDLHPQVQSKRDLSTQNASDNRTSNRPPRVSSLAHLEKHILHRFEDHVEPLIETGAKFDELVSSKAALTSRYENNRSAPFPFAEKSHMEPIIEKTATQIEKFRQEYREHAKILVNELMDNKNRIQKERDKLSRTNPDSGETNPNSQAIDGLTNILDGIERLKNQEINEAKRVGAIVTSEQLIQRRTDTPSSTLERSESVQRADSNSSTENDNLQAQTNGHSSNDKTRIATRLKEAALRKLQELAIKKIPGYKRS